jgi:hypothetical protein
MRKTARQKQQERAVRSAGGSPRNKIRRRCIFGGLALRCRHEAEKYWQEAAVSVLFGRESGTENSSRDISLFSLCPGTAHTVDRFREEAYQKGAASTPAKIICPELKLAAAAAADGKQPRVNVILVDTVAFPWHARADAASNLYDEVLEFHHGRDLPSMAKTLKQKYPDSQFDISTDTHGNSGRAVGYKLLQQNGGVEYVKYGELEEALAGANISEKSVRIFYGGCNAATGYYNARLSPVSRRYERVTYGSASMNAQGDYEPSTDFLRMYENDPRYGLLSEIKRPYPDEINGHAHTVPLEKREYKVKLEDIAKIRKTDPAVFEARIREFARSYRQPVQYYRNLASPQ